MPRRSAKTPPKTTPEKLPPIPPGFTLRHILRGHTDFIGRIAWSPDGRTLASPSYDKTIRIWDAETGRLLQTLTGHDRRVVCVAWSPDGNVLASASSDQTIRLWNVVNGQLLQTLSGHNNWVNCVAWSPDGNVLASGSKDRTIRFWNTETGQFLQTLTGHDYEVTCVTWSPGGKVLASASSDQTIRLWNAVNGQLLQTLTGHTNTVWGLAWSPDGEMLASSSKDQTIRLWNPHIGQQLGILEGHTSYINCVSFSHDGRLLASKSGDSSVRLWRVDSLEMVTILPEKSAKNKWPPGLAFHPKAPILATLGEADTVIRIWDLDFATLLRTTPATPTVHYTNAKVVLLGDSGVGKSGLGLVLNRHAFVPTESTHGRHVWTMESQEVQVDDRRREMRETLLWDLAGQPGYRLIHQLHLNEVAVALVVFDARSETDPFMGVHHWVRALQVARRVQGNSALPMKKLLVAARVDRGGKAVSRTRVKALMRELGFDDYFETSAKEGLNIPELAGAIQHAIDWAALPKVSSTELFQRIKDFLLSEKETGRLLSTVEDLYRAFLKIDTPAAESEDLQAQFETCIGRLESRDLIRRLSFGNLVLLQPEVLDIYASALVNAVKDEPDGLGSINEKKARKGDFHVPKGERLQDKEQEKLLLIAMVEDLLRFEIVLREQADDGAYLVFPSQTTRENPDLPEPEGKSVIFGFEGPVINIYTTLAVRLSYSGIFKKKEMWKNAMTYTAKVGGTYGLFLNNMGEGRAELTLFFDKAAKEETRFHFEEYIKTHLDRRALPETMRRRRIFTCSGCGWLVTEQTMQLLAQRGSHTLNCPICHEHILLLDHEDRLAAPPSSLVAAMDRAADSQRNREAAQSTVQGKIETNDFDVFLCHNGKDKLQVKQIGEKLKEHGILPWLDEWELPPGQPWRPLLEQQIGHIKSAAVFLGKHEMGRVQKQEMYALLSEFVDRGCPVIPVLLPDAPGVPQLPIFLREMTWVDFRQQNPDPIKRLIWGITGKHG